MTFREILPHFLKGEKVFCLHWLEPEWNQGESYIYIVVDYSDIILHRGSSEEDYIFDVADFEAEDWQLFDEKEIGQCVK